MQPMKTKTLISTGTCLAYQSSKVNVIYVRILNIYFTSACVVQWVADEVAML